MPGAPSIDPVKAAAAYTLQESGHSGRQIARMTGLPRGSVHDILSGRGRWKKVPELPVFRRLRQEQSQRLEAAFRQGTSVLLERAFDDEKLAKASTFQLIYASGIAIDKARLLAGESTENVAHLHLHEIPALDRLAEKLGQTLLQRQSEQKAAKV